MKSVLGFVLCRKARGVCQVYCLDQKFVPRKLKIELMSYVCLEEFRYRKLITFRFDKKPATYKDRKMDWIERERRRNLRGPQRWTSAPASMLLNHFIRHRKAFWMRVTVTWSDLWGDGPSRNFVPFIWFTDQVFDDIVNGREFVFRIWTQTGFTSKHEGFKGIVKVKKEPNIVDENMLLVVDDKPSISSAETPLMPEQLGRESREKEAKCTEELITFNEEERRQRNTKEIRESEIKDSYQQEEKEEENEKITNNSQEKEVEQMNPNPPPLSPPLLPLRFRFLSQDIPPGQIVFPSAREPTPFRLKQMVDDMYGRRATDRTDWTKPFTFDSENCAKEEGTQPMDASECNTDISERHTRQIRESDIKNNNQEQCKDENEAIPNNSEDREASNTSEEEQDDQTIDGESEGRPAADVGVVRRVTRTLKKVMWVTVTVVAVLVVADALVLEVPED